jgi:hypothetical protein
VNRREKTIGLLIDRVQEMTVKIRSKLLLHTKIKGGGRGRPPYISDRKLSEMRAKIKSKVQPHIKIKVKGGGQECPPHTIASAPTGRLADVPPSTAWQP